jgi:hypothetical protein
MKPLNLIIAVGVFALLVGAGYAYLATISANTTGIAYKSHGAEGNCNANGGGDLLDTTAYVTSWTGGGISEKVIVQGKFRLYWDVPGSTEVKRVQYRITIDGIGDGVKINGVATKYWESTWYQCPAQDVFPDKWYPSDVCIVSLTNPFSGKIHAEYWADQQWDFGLNSGINKLSEDEAWLKSGIGLVKVIDDVVEEGQTATFHVETGYASSTKIDVPSVLEGWFLDIYNPAGTSVRTWKIPDNFNGEYYWLVPTGSYKPTWDNTYRIVLRNELLMQDDDWFFTVGPGMLDQIPAKPTFKILEGTEPFDKGEKITVRLSCVKTYNNVKGFNVWVSYETTAGGTTEYLIYKQFFSATLAADGTYWADVSWSWPEAGNAKLEASTLDVLNLNSGITEMAWEINYSPPDEPGDYDWFGIIMGIIIAIVAVVIGIVLILKAPMPYGAILGVIVIAVGVLVGIWMILGSLTV